MNSAFKLCLVEDVWAWFTSCPLRQQWGDGWSTSPYYLNSGRPYEWNPDRECAPDQLCKVAFEGPFEFPDRYSLYHTPLSVRDINMGMAPWLLAEREGVIIEAGTPYPEFVHLVLNAGGMVYIPVVHTWGQQKC